MQDSYALSAPQPKIQEAGKGCCKVRTIEQELVLACIKTYTEVTQKPIQASSLAQRKFPSEILNAVLNKDTGELMEMRQLLRNPKYSDPWGKSYTKELRRLAQGILGTKGTDTIVFIKYNEIPLDQRRNVTYGKMVVTYWPEKDDPNQTKLTVGGNQIVCPFDVSTPNGQDDDSQNALKQCHINKRSALLHNRLEGLLPQHTYEAARAHAIEIK
jgi:hypothetical protein